MASHRQLEANRANATRSTGPRSANGKARSSRNSLTHGLTAEDIVIGDEDPAEFELLLAGLRADFRPTTMIERKLVERLAGLIWRLQRIPALEAALFDVRQEETAPGDYFTLNVTREEQAILSAVWDSLQEPSYRKFLEDFRKSIPTPATPKAEHSSDVGQASDALKTEDVCAVEKKPNPAPSPDSAQACHRAGAEKPGTPKRYPPRRPLRLRLFEDGADGRRSIHTGLALIKDAEKHDVLGKLSRYEASLANAVARTLSLLHSIQNSGLVHNDELAASESEARRS